MDHWFCPLLLRVKQTNRTMVYYFLFPQLIFYPKIPEAVASHFPLMQISYEIWTLGSVSRCLGLLHHIGLLHTFNTYLHNAQHAFMKVDQQKLIVTYLLSSYWHFVEIVRSFPFYNYFYVTLFIHSNLEIFNFPLS